MMVVGSEERRLAHSVEAAVKEEKAEEMTGEFPEATAMEIATGSAVEVAGVVAAMEEARLEMVVAEGTEVILVVVVPAVEEMVRVGQASEAEVEKDVVMDARVAVLMAVGEASTGWVEERSAAP